MKSIVISIRPEHALNILNGSKTLELRKSVPKGFVGWVYIYCTKGGGNLVWGSPLSHYVEESYVLTYGYSTKEANDIFGILNGKVVARFWFEEYEEVLVQHHIDSEQIERVLKQACIEHDDLDNYVGNKETIYAWHIKNLEVFDKPMELSEFYKKDYYATSDYYYIPVTNAPQSWQYVYVKGE